MKNIISRSLVIATLMSPVITHLAATAHISPGIDTSINTVSVSDTVQTDNSERKNNPLYDASGKEVVNPLYNPAKNLTTRKRVEVLKSNKNSEADYQRKGWDGSIKGNSKGINEAGIKRTGNQRKGWDGTVKGGNIQEESINGINNPTDNMQHKANINTSRSNIKRGIHNSADSIQHKANINTSRSNIKRGIKNPADNVHQEEAGSMSNPYFQNNGNVGEMPGQHIRGIDKKDIKRGPLDNTETIQPIRNDSTSQNADRGVPANRLKTKHDTAKNSVGNIR